MSSERFTRAKARVFLLIAWIAWTGAAEVPPPRAEDGDPGQTAVRVSVSDTLETAERRALLYSRPAPEAAGESMSPSLRFTHPLPPLLETRGPVRLNTFQRTVYAADRGANAGLLIGTLGSVMGWWDEDTAWYLMGAGVALGAIQGAATEGN